ncbi:MAG: hypothetical protein OEW58_11100 [Gammaproteobacteria bacterium]|nr:hypothetical protein [Gammaproteobacteria bacterium]
MTGQRQQDIISNACWRHIGVLGDKPGTCSELARVIHCQTVTYLRKRLENYLIGAHAVESSHCH